MSGRIGCANCGARIDLPAGYSKARIRCTSCGYYADVPPDQRSVAGGDDAIHTERPPVATPRSTGKAVPIASKVKKRSDPRDHRPSFETDEPAGPNLLEGSQTEDDDKPYAVPGSGTKACPHCRQELPLDAMLCVHCGTEIETGRKRKKRDFDTVDRTWEAVAPLKKRLLLLGVLQAVNVVLAIITLTIGTNGGAFGALFFLAVQGGLQAFLVGTFETLTVKRNAKGSAQLINVWRIAFIPLKPTKVAWKTSEGVGVIATHNPGMLEWATFIYLVLLCVLPGVLFWYVVIRPERFELALCDVHGSTEGVFFRTTNREVAEEIGKTIADSTGLMFRPVL